MRDENAYKEIVNAILKSKIMALGQLAINKARTVSGMQLNEKGEVVLFSADPKQVVDNFLVKFEELSGIISTHIAKISIIKILAKYPDIELPDRLKS